MPLKRETDEVLSVYRLGYSLVQSDMRRCFSSRPSEKGVSCGSNLPTGLIHLISQFLDPSGHNFDASQGGLGCSFM